MRKAAFVILTATAQASILIYRYARLWFGL